MEALLDNTNVPDEKRLLVEHGIDILISDGRNILCVFIWSLLLHNTRQALVYLLVLSTLRVHTGGWHASSEMYCFITYQWMFFLFSYLLHFQISEYLCFFLLFFSIVYILIFSPVQHRYNPLSEDEIKKNRNYCVLYCFLYSVLFFITGLSSNMYPRTIVITFVFNVTLMEMLRKSKNYRYHENQMRNRRRQY